VNGLHASTPDEWVDRLSRLLADASLRRRLGLAGLETVERGYSARSQAPRVLEILADAAGRREPRLAGAANV